MRPSPWQVNLHSLDRPVIQPDYGDAYVEEQGMCRYFCLREASHSNTRKPHGRKRFREARADGVSRYLNSVGPFLLLR